MNVTGRVNRAGRVLVALGFVVGGMVFAGSPQRVRALGVFDQIPTRLYMIPDEHSMVVPDLLAGLVIPITEMKFADDPVGDVISAQSREIKITAAEQAGCNVASTTAPPYSETGCTAIQLTVGNGTLRFDPAPTPEDDPMFPGSSPQVQMYRFSSGVLLRDADSADDLEGPKLNLIGKSEDMDDVLKTLVYTPTVDDPATEIDEDYYYDGSDPEELTVQLVPGDGSGSVTRDVSIRVLDYNNFPDVDVPEYQWSVASGAEVEMFTPNVDPLEPPDAATLQVSDEDNDEVIDQAQDGDDPDNDPGDGDDPDDGAGDEFLVIAWASCGTFSLWSQNGWAIVDDLEHIFDYVYDQASDPLASDAGQKQQLEDAFFELLPDEVELLPFTNANPTNFNRVFAGVSNDIDELNYQLARMTFKAADESNNPLQDTTCEVRVLISDLGNNGLPLHYLGDPEFGVEIPMFGVDLLGTNDAPGVEKYTVKVGGGTEIDVTLPPAVAVAEGGTTPMELTVSPVEHPAFQVEVTTADGVNTTAGADYTAKSSQIVTVPEDATSVAISPTVDAVANAVVDPSPRTYTLSLDMPLDPPDGYSITSSQPSTLVTILDDDTPPPTLSIGDVTMDEGDSGTTTFSFPLTLSGPSTSMTSVVATTSNDTATTADLDYAATSQTVNFAPGDTSEMFTVTVNGDTRFELNEDFDVTLTIPSGLTTPDTTAVGTITNDDPTPTISITDVTEIEGNSGTTPFVFTVTLSNPSADTITVDAAASDGSATQLNTDYAPAGETLTFLPGEVSKTFTVNANGDTTPEPNETFNVALTAPTNATIADPGGLGTITNDDLPPGTVGVQIDDVSLAEGTGGAPTAFTFTLSLTGPPTASAALGATVVNGSATTADADFAPNPTTVDFPSGQSGTQTFTVLVGTDSKYEVDETFSVVLSAPTGPLVILDDIGLGTIENDDTMPTLMIDDVAELEGDSGNTPLEFTVTLMPASGVAATVQLATADGSAIVGDADYAAANGTVTFLPGETSKTFTVDATGDTNFEPDETFDVSLATPVEASIADGTGAGTIENDDDEPTISITDVTQLEGNSGTSSFVFNVSLSNPSSETVTVDADTGDGTALLSDNDYAASFTTVTFPPGDVSETVAVTVNGDTAPEADEMFEVTLSNAQNASAADSGIGTITNDDAPVVQPLPLSIQVPGNIVRDADPNQSGAIVTYPAPTTTGGTPPVAISCSHASGAFYPIGVTTVTCTATDAAADESPWHLALADPAVFIVAAMTVSGTFTITVNQPAATTTVPEGSSPSTTIPGSGTPGGTVPPEHLPPAGPSVTPSGGLPETGSNVSDLLIVGVAALALGGFLLLLRRRPSVPR